MTIGVPTAPKETGVLWIIIPISTAANAGKPMATSKGAAIAAGVPKPEAPSIKVPKHQAMIIAWTLLSGEMLVKPWRITSIAPVYFNVLSRKIAPNTIHKTDTVITKPCRIEAPTRTADISHAKSAISAVLANTTGIALFADHCKPNSSTAESVIGNNANNPRVISFMSFPLIIIS